MPGGHPDTIAHELNSVPAADAVDPQRERLLQIATWLVAATLAYNVIEGIVAIWFGVAADSDALVAFGLDSGIECFAAGVMLWRLRSRHDDERREVFARKAIGASFLVLAAYVVAQSCWTLVAKEAPSTSLVGIVLGSLSLLIMPGLSWAKLRLAARLESKALRAEALETLACSYLTVTLLIGLGANSLLGSWWADPAAAMLMVPWLVREGLEGVRGSDGCASKC